MSPAGTPGAILGGIGLLLVVVSAGCSIGGPPEPPPRLGPPSLEDELVRFAEPEVGRFLSPPPAPAREPGDPILGSSLADDPEVRRRIHFWILRWQTWGQGYFTRYLQRMALYEDLVDEKIAERGLPASLRYLPVVESGYNPHAVSPVGAGGMWQFMSATARFLGLRITPLVDERRDPWRSTDVALDYLVQLHDRFEGSWFFALAAYNVGWGRVERILARHADGVEATDSLFWALRHHFPWETREFVPKLLAAARLAADPPTYGFSVPEDATGVGDVVEVRLPDATSLDVIADAAGVSVQEVEALNPQLLRGYTPPGRETVVRIPSGREDAFQERYAAIPPTERVSFVEHKIRGGQTLSHVSARYRVPMSELRAANPGLDPRRLRIGQWIVVPRSPSAVPDPVVEGVRVAAAQPETGPNRGGGPSASAIHVEDEDGDGLTHEVSSGESLWLIARRHGVSVEDIRRWNGLVPGAVLYPGKKLKVYGGGPAVYRVRPGDTLSEIALRHGVDTSALLRANGLSGSAVIRPGDEVRIPRPGGS